MNVNWIDSNHKFDIYLKLDKNMSIHSVKLLLDVEKIKWKRYLSNDKGAVKKKLSCHKWFLCESFLIGECQMGFFYNAADKLQRNILI